jgi:hypothetical protein
MTYDKKKKELGGKPYDLIESYQHSPLAKKKKKPSTCFSYSSLWVQSYQVHILSTPGHKLPKLCYQTNDNESVGGVLSGLVLGIL